jgi:hypothetical protein
LGQGLQSSAGGALSEVAPEPTGDPGDIATIAAADGPASSSAGALLPAPTQHGDFAKISWREVLLRFYERRATGVLAIEGFRESRWCYLLEGRPLHFLGDHPHPGEFLSDVLVGEGTISSADWAEALTAQQATGLRAGDYLVKTQRLTRKQLDQALSKRAQRITRKLMGMNFGTFRFHPYRELVGLFPFEPVPVLDVVLQEQRAAIETLTDEVVLGQATPLYALHCRLVLPRLELLKEMPLTKEERRLVFDVLPANWTLGELVSLREMPELVQVRFLLVLKDLGLVEFVRDEGEGKERNRAEREIYAQLRGMLRRNEFDALGAHWSSSEEEIQAAHRSLIERFSEPAYSGLVDDKICGLLLDVQQLAGEILGRISNQDDRRKRRRDLVGADEVRIAAELLQTHAQTARSKANFAVVKVCSQRIVDLNPEGNEGREMLARAQKWLSDASISSAGPPQDEELVAIRQDLARLN